MSCVFDFDNINKWGKEVLSRFTKTRKGTKLRWRTFKKFTNWPTGKDQACPPTSVPRRMKFPQNPSPNSLHSWHYDLSIHYLWFLILLHFSQFPIFEKMLTLILLTAFFSQLPPILHLPDLSPAHPIRLASLQPRQGLRSAVVKMRKML